MFNLWYSSEAGNVTVQQLIDTLPNTVVANSILGQHYFIDNGAGGIAPVWDSRAIPEFQGVDDAVFVGKVLANVSDPNLTENVSWLHLGKVSGDIADEVYRIFTVGGVPPSSVRPFQLIDIAGAFALGPMDDRIYTSLLFSVSVEQRKIYPSNTFPSIGSLAVPWD